MSRAPQQQEQISAEDTFGVLEWFQFQDKEFVERALRDLRRLGVKHLRTGISWADWMRPDGEAWISWLFERIGQEDLELLPCFLYTPPSLGEVERTSSPPQNLRDYADFIALMIENFGQYFQYIELWNEPNNLSEWDFTRDGDFSKFARMIYDAAHWAKLQGKTTVLGGMSPIDPGWLGHMIDLGLLEVIDVIGVHGFPGTWEKNWSSWSEQIAHITALLKSRGITRRLWITEVGYSSRGHRQAEQLQVFLDALEAPAERVYWYGLYDLAQERPSILGLHIDEREYHCGIKESDGSPKLLYRLLEASGPSGVREICGWSARQKPPPQNAALITGGAGFVGSNLAARLLSMGRDVVIFDNLSRPGVERNLRWLLNQFERKIWLYNADIRNQRALRSALRGVSEVYHFAGQTAVTTSLDDPIKDFSANARGTLNLLEELRRLPAPPPLIFTSTNKVYGDLPDIKLQEAKRRYQPSDPRIAERGVGEERPLDLYSPYGCSKGVADQYVLDYARTFGLPACVFRMSCVYGPRQMGTEDQGWVAHFLIRAIKDQPITIFGDGKQVRDLLFVDDLVDALISARCTIDKARGRAFNIGGGSKNTMSLLEFIPLIEELTGRALEVEFSRWRPGDQRYFVSNTHQFSALTGWRPRVEHREGIKILYRWLLDQHTRPQNNKAPLAGVKIAASLEAHNPDLRSGRAS